MKPLPMTDCSKFLQAAIKLAFTTDSSYKNNLIDFYFYHITKGSFK